jgi:hypothetical protein
LVWLLGGPFHISAGWRYTANNFHGYQTENLISAGAVHRTEKAG